MSEWRDLMESIDKINDSLQPNKLKYIPTGDISYALGLSMITGKVFVRTDNEVYQIDDRPMDYKISPASAEGNKLEELTEEDLEITEWVD